MARVILLNKPYGILCQFNAPAGRPCLKDLVPVPSVYPAGRLDLDSEGLVVLTDDGALQARLSDPRRKAPKVYWVQVEGVPSADGLALLRSGVDLGEFRSRPCRADVMDEPEALWAREPAIRMRRNIPTCWLRVELVEGKNRQVRRMTAKVGHPTLRLIRAAVGPWTIEGLNPGAWREVGPAGF
jgi:23S rRNA pseudouridine2457 synthase